MKWRLLPGFELYFRSWSNEHIVYHSGSCNTHMLDEYGFYALQCLKQGGGDIDTITQYVADELNLELADELKDHMRDVVDQLGTHRLLELDTSENS